ncbi:MAG: four helix bundle protein [Syntrophales bacterium LBB04]|nr:four helix bundle protein [Syntrophales bacterium LBB04]
MTNDELRMSNGKTTDRSRMKNDELRLTNGNPRDLKERTQRFAIEVIRFCGGLAKTQEMSIIGKQLIRSASSVGANYRAVCRAKSKADFIAKLSIVEEEADESMYWFELLEGLGLRENADLKRLKDEAAQLVAIVVASKKTARGRLK